MRAHQLSLLITQKQTPSGSEFNRRSYSGYKKRTYSIMRRVFIEETHNAHRRVRYLNFMYYGLSIGSHPIPDPIDTTTGHFMINFRSNIDTRTICAPICVRLGACFLSKQRRGWCRLVPKLREWVSPGLLLRIHIRHPPSGPLDDPKLKEP